MNLYTFHRSDGFYPVELVNDVEAAHHVLFNPGTVKVVNHTTGKVVYDSGDSGPDIVLMEQPHTVP